jgi:class 3 adenylate cyclase
MDLQRQLAAVMFTDIEGFTALMQTDESAAIAGRDKYLAVLEQHHGAFGGEIVQFLGDGSLSGTSGQNPRSRCGSESTWAT